MFYRVIGLLAAFFIMHMTCFAQRHEIFMPGVKSLEVMVDDRWTDFPPVITLNSDEHLNVGFDDLTHEQHRYAYRLTHCEADWTESKELFQSDYVEGFADGNLIEDTQESINTHVLYTHYTLQFPNSQCKPKISGNYKLTIYDDNNNGAPVCQVCFMVCEKSMGVALDVTDNTDIDINGKHQQVNMTLSYGSLRVTDWQREVKTLVMQNGRWDNAVANAKPQYVMSDGLRWSHCRDYIFDGGNEFRKFEILDPDHTTLGIEHINWDGKDYQAYLWTDEPRPSYVYDEDADGAFLLRNSDDSEGSYTSEYVNVHFRLKTERQNNDIYLSGNWTNGSPEAPYRMTWNDQTGLYETQVQLKLGYYNYQYLCGTDEGKLRTLESEGNFYQTENTYCAYIYYRGIGERTDRLVAVGKIRH